MCFQAQAVADMNQRDFQTQWEQEERRVSVCCVEPYVLFIHLGSITISFLKLFVDKSFYHIFLIYLPFPPWLGEVAFSLQAMLICALILFILYITIDFILPYSYLVFYNHNVGRGLLRPWTFE